MPPETTNQNQEKGQHGRYAPPILYLAFANRPDAPLDNLVVESREVHKALLPGEQKGYFNLHREEFAELDTIAQHLAIFRNQVRIFHYGGHADSSSLLLHDLEANAEGIGTMLAQQKDLALVFLNGCSTQKQVASLLDKGVPAVIATSAPVNDTRAKDFAIQFYRALSNGYSIGDSFDMARGYLEALQAPPIAFHRDIAFEPGTVAVDTAHWGLFTRQEEAIQWTLPNQPLNLVDMIDPASLAAAAVAALIPYLTKGGEELAQGIGKDLWELIKKPFKSDNKKLEDLRNNPEDTKIQGKVEGKLEDMLAEDHAFAATLRELLDRMPKPGTVNSIAVTGDHNTVLQGVRGSTVTLSITTTPDPDKPEKPHGK